MSEFARLFPEQDAQGWDAVGLTVGDPAARIDTVLLAVDATAATVAEAERLGAGLLITHHPLLLRGVTTVRADSYKGALVSRLIRAGCALFTAHTNADADPSLGPTGQLMRRLNVESMAPIEPLAHDETRGIGLVGDLQEPVSLAEFAARVAAILPDTAAGLRIAGDPGQVVQRVACCSGAGDSLLRHPLVTSADVYITSDLRHHPASEAREQALLTGGPALVDISHSAGEWVWLEALAEKLRNVRPMLRVEVSHENTDPWTFCVNHATEQEMQ